MRELRAWPAVSDPVVHAPSTVSKHLANLYTKLGVKTRTAAVARFAGPTDVENGG